MTAQLHRNTGVRVSAQPLLDRYNARIDANNNGSGRLVGGEGFSLWISTSNERALYRARRDGDIDYWIADRLAVEVLRVHPRLVWGDEWDEADRLLDLAWETNNAPTRGERAEARARVRELRAQYQPPVAAQATAA